MPEKQVSAIAIKKNKSVSHKNKQTDKKNSDDMSRVQSEVAVDRRQMFSSKINKKSIIFSLVVMALLALAAAPSYYFYREYKRAQLQLTNPSKAAQIEVDETIKKIGKLIVLPAEEVPSFATVSDASKLQNQDFFKNAQNGDKVLIYSKAKKAILYRPSENRLVDVSPLQIAEQIQPTTSPQITSIKEEILPVKTVVLNGTQVVGLGGIVEKELVSKIDIIDVVDVANATQKNYKKTLVISLSKYGEAKAKEIAQRINAEVTNLPNTEKPPKDTDIIVIIGSDRIAASPSASVTSVVSPTSADRE